MDFINDVTLKDSKLIFSSNDRDGNKVEKDVITMDTGITTIESDTINLTSEIRISRNFGDPGEVLLTPTYFNFNDAFKVLYRCEGSLCAYEVSIDKSCPVIVDSCAIFNNKLESTSEFKAASISADSISTDCIGTSELTTIQLTAASATMSEFKAVSINATDFKAVSIKMADGGFISSTEFEQISTKLCGLNPLVINGASGGVIITNEIESALCNSSCNSNCNGNCNGNYCLAPFIFINNSEIKLAAWGACMHITNDGTKIYSQTDINGKLRVHSEFSTNHNVTFEDISHNEYISFTSKIPSIFEENVEFKKPVVSTDSISASEFKTPGVVIHGDSIDVLGKIKVGTEFNLAGAFNAKYNSGTKTGSVTIDSTSPLTVNSKAIFNGGICTKSISSIAGTQIFDTTDGKGFNFKGLYTLNGFQTTAPFFKQESATNSWIDVTTLKEGGTALSDKYALKTTLSDYALKTDISNVYKYVGSLDTYSALPTTGQNVGDVYNIINADSTNNIAAGDNVAWTGSSWDKLGGNVDLSNYAEKSTTLAGYGITDVYTKAEIDSKNVSFLTKESSGIQTISSDLALTGYVLIDNLSIDELEIASLTASSKVTLGGGLDVTGGVITVGGKEVATKDDIPDVADVKTPIFKYFQNPVIPASCSLFAIATNVEFENMPMMQLVRNSDNKIVSADISWKSNTSGGYDIMVGIDHSTQINANTYTLQAFGY